MLCRVFALFTVLVSFLFLTEENLVLGCRDEVYIRTYIHIYIYMYVVYCGYSEFSQYMYVVW